jgi:hypothetical protein
VIKETKSGPIMQLRFQLYDHYNTNYHDLVAKASNCQKLKFRLNYALMFTAFEIKNDMERSVWFYDQLEIDLLRGKDSFSLPWVSSHFKIDLA